MVGSAGVELLSAGAQNGIRRTVLQTPGSQVCEYRDELDCALGQAVCGPSSAAGVVAGEQSALDQAPQPVGEDVGGNALLGLGLQLTEVASIAEHHITQDQ